ncbi:MAG: CRISPR-associated endonuclease Cas1 [Burkholderiales bacterium]|nr:CRISPR-associated endonuclease Cas1 [Burkholderiales bacterium]MDE1926905.1 CRISPR-associated endonuclease Cas1 [Burkholderiales bacterium]MDE2157524.1 CRISPR-associated endonuclease Cas1 [Burkholderiales bacterium]MDE2501730.1 CRISPR-associated endonuclease Cas1 [Burkholderiales bacterium]
MPLNDPDGEAQPSLPLDAPPLPAGVPLLPARMINEFVYCPRLAYLEWVQGEWADSAETVEGRAVHRRVDRPRGKPPSPRQPASDDKAGEEAPERVHVHSLELSSNALGLVARLDLAEFEGRHAVPVDYKRGRRPHVAQGAYEPERVQLCVQALLLEEHGYESSEGVLYFVAGKERVKVVFDADLRESTRQAAAGLRLLASGGRIPPPLENSPKCPRCSLAPICLPDEVHYLRTQQTPPRPLAVDQPVALPMYVQARGAKVAKSGDTLEVSVDDQKQASARLMDVSQLVLQGGVYLTGPALHELMAREIPVTWLSHGGWFLGHTIGLGHRNVELRTAQYRASFDAAHCLRLARDIVIAKIRNQRTLLRRNWKQGEMPEALLLQFRQDIDAAGRAHDLGQLLGVEGQAAARYFAHFGRMLSGPNGDDPDAAWGFDFERRTRRPPADRVNALLSYAYALLARSIAVTATGVGFDTYRGFYHQPRYGRPALALDLMEPFRPLIADSVVLTAINNGELGADDFVCAGGAVNLDERGRRAFIGVFERRLSQEVTHPLFGYAAQYRQIVELQCRLLARHLLGEFDRYPNFVTR